MLAAFTATLRAIHKGIAHTRVGHPIEPGQDGPGSFTGSQAGELYAQLHLLKYAEDGDLCAIITTAL